MKKKLVSILLSLSMCASYAMPLTTAAAEPAESEDISVVETVVPNAEREPQTDSPSALKLTTSGSNITMEYGDKLEAGEFSYYKVAGSWANPAGDDYNSGVSTDGTYPVLELAKSTDTKFLTVNGKEIKAENITKNAVPVILTLKAKKDDLSYKAEIKLNVTVVPKDLSKLKPADIEASYAKSADGKTYNTVDDFVAKYKGAKGFTAKVTLPKNGDTKIDLTKKDMKSVSAFVEDDYKNSKVVVGGKTLYYTVPGTSGADGAGGTITGGSIVTTAGIKVEGKGNYKGSFVVTGQPVALQPQRINVGTISGATVTFGSIANILDGMSTDDYKDYINPSDEKAATAKLYKFTFKSAGNAKPIKIDSKDGKVTVKDVPEKEAEREVEVTIQNKKNKLCESKVKFKVAPLEITTQDPFGFDWTKVVGTDSKPKTYKNFVDFESKFIGKDATNAKASGLVFTYKADANSKAAKLKANKDFTVTMKPNGDKSTALKSGNLEPTAYFNNRNEVVTTATIEIRGKGKFTGVVTEPALIVPMEIQTITAAGAAYEKIATVTYGSVNEINVFDNISIDNALDSAGKPFKLSDDTGKADIIKQLKVKVDKNSGLKVDKNGFLSVKNVANANGKVTVSSKKNSKSVDAVYTITFKVDAATVTDANVRIDTSKVDGKTFTDKAAAKKAAEKVTVLSTIAGKDKKLKAGSGKDYDKITVTQLDADNNTNTSAESETGPALKFQVSANLSGNYQGSVSETIDCTAKK